jgi:hypothetical protein
MARTTISKIDILDDTGYVYNFDRQMYVNRKARKAFSVEFLQDHTENQIEERIARQTDGSWQFYFNSEPSESVRHELERVLG